MSPVLFVASLSAPAAASVTAESVVSAMIIVVVSFLVYFLPYLLARGRKKQNRQAIFWLNFLAGWTFVGWIVALVWALTKDPVADRVPTAEAVLCAACGKFGLYGSKFCANCGAQRA